MVLADVGVSGGIADYWRQFEPSFQAFGFDPLVTECSRLAATEKNPKVEFFDAFVGYEGYASLFPQDVAKGSWSNQPFPRTSAARAQHLQSIPAAQRYNNEDPDVIYAKRKISLDAFFGERPQTLVDFIKVDTDGSDYEVLCGAERTLGRHCVLGLLVETQFHGISHIHSNLFANIDRLLRERGFSLFDLDVYNYTRGVLPGHFVYRIPAQTRQGQVLAGDALYLRDVAAPGYEEHWKVKLPPEKLLKLVCLFEMFSLPDCAAELLLAKKEEVRHHMDVDQALGLLTRQVHPAARGLDEIDRRFQRSPEHFYPVAAAERFGGVLPARLRRALSALKRMLRG